MKKLFLFLSSISGVAGILIIFASVMAIKSAVWEKPYSSDIPVLYGKKIWLVSSGGLAPIGEWIVIPSRILFCLGIAIIVISIIAFYIKKHIKPLHIALGITDAFTLSLGMFVLLRLIKMENLHYRDAHSLVLIFIPPLILIFISLVLVALTFTIRKSKSLNRVMPTN